ncbi:hypothetical protein Phi14:2_gp003 [Cellulophaga phage phi14:2]|uniref:Uncharacterized protein n=1 Tax=Cellulophaga phage phi14:2 TaxID=1327990 RepID=S0A0H5_9CAUD|nr:hypothetical protein Phi14:2_gp003 [Cellulophaga phage phi14:2]
MVAPLLRYETNSPCRLYQQLCLFFNDIIIVLYLVRKS